VGGPYSKAVVADYAMVKARWRFPRFSIWLHLAFLVLPLMVLVTITVVGRTDQAATEQREVSELVSRAQDVAQLNRLDSSTRQENAMALINVAIRSYGIDRAVATQLLGFNPQEALVGIRVQTDRAIDAMGERSSEFQARYARARAQLEDTSVLGESPMAVLLSELRAEIEMKLDDIDTRSRRVTVDSQVASNVRELRLALAAVAASLDEIGAVANLSINLEKTSDRELLDRFFVERNNFVSSMTELSKLDSKLGDQATSMMASTEFINVREFSDAQLDRRMAAQTNIDPKAIAPFVSVSSARSSTVLLLVDTALAELDSTVSLIKTRTTDQVTRDVTVSLVALAIGIVGAGLVTRRIVRPMRQLRNQSMRLIQGHEVHPVKVRGPSEIAVSVRAFNELVQSVQLIETQAGALANGDLDHPCLAIPAPGRIGRSMQEAVGRLKRSIGEQRILRNELSHDASHDRLTGVLNRSGVFDEIRRRLSAQPVQVSSLIFIDLDGFKAINDQLGHAAGDAVLGHVAQRIVAAVGPEHVVARLGGDEFVIALAPPTTIDDAKAVSLAVIAAISEPIDLAAQGHVCVSASAGIASVDEADDVSGLLYAADLAVYRAKAAGRACVEVFDESFRVQISDAARVEAEVREALAAGAIHRHVQPVVDAHTGALAGCEALLRWQRDDGTFVPPTDYLPTAEMSQLIVDIDLAGVAWACDQLVEWRTIDGLRGTRLAINLSARTAQYWDLVRVFERELSRTGIDPKLLEIEITETLFVEDMRVMRTNVDALAALGVVTAIDDFGTGHTSIDQLLSLDADLIKIDRSLSKEACTTKGAQILRAVVDLAHAAGAQVVAEGIETAEVARALHGLGVDFFQGFLIARPMAVNDLHRWLDDVASGQIDVAHDWLGVTQTSLKA
jgi:diguanylate cyclase (GGDEF)-like protein